MYKFRARLRGDITNLSQWARNREKCGHSWLNLGDNGFQCTPLICTAEKKLGLPLYFRMVLEQRAVPVVQKPLAFK